MGNMKNIDTLDFKPDIWYTFKDRHDKRAWLKQAREFAGNITSELKFEALMDCALLCLKTQTGKDGGTRGYLVYFRTRQNTDPRFKINAEVYENKSVQYKYPSEHDANIFWTTNDTTHFKTEIHQINLKENLQMTTFINNHYQTKINDLEADLQYSVRELLMKADPKLKEVHDAINLLSVFKLLIEDYKVDAIFQAVLDNGRTPAVIALEEKYEAEINRLKAEWDEVKVLMNIADTYKDKVNILTTYNIISKK